MAMTRRGLFQFFTAAAIAADPEKLLWTPGQKKIFIPPAAEVGLSSDQLYAWLQALSWKKRPNTDASAFGECYAVLASLLGTGELTNPPHMTNLSPGPVYSFVDACR
jgi:hypothetical protein